MARIPFSHCRGHKPSPFSLSHDEHFFRARQTFKKGVDQDEARRRREETSISVRKSKKEDRLNKRRGGELCAPTRHALKRTFSLDPLSTARAALTPPSPPSELPL